MPPVASVDDLGLLRSWSCPSARRPEGGRGLLGVAYSRMGLKRSTASDLSETAGQRPFHEAERRAWDSNPRDRSPGLAVFKTAAIVH